MVSSKKKKNGVLTRSLREQGGPCTKSMEVSESRMERVKKKNGVLKKKKKSKRKKKNYLSRHTARERL